MRPAVASPAIEVDLAGRQRAIAERQVHHVRRPGEAQAVRPRQARVAVGALEKLVAEAGPPLRRFLRRIVDRPEAERARVRAAHQDRERVVETERRQQRPPGVRVQVAHAREDRRSASRAIG